MYKVLCVDNDGNPVRKNFCIFGEMEKAQEHALKISKEGLHAAIFFIIEQGKTKFILHKRPFNKRGESPYQNNDHGDRRYRMLLTMEEDDDTRDLMREICFDHDIDMEGMFADIPDEECPKCRGQGCTYCLL